jgi:hypothetical protein
VHVDRVACPWLIQRFIDSEAEFEFVEWPGTIMTKDNGIPFDFPDLDIQFTHHDGKCTFEVLVNHFEIQDPILHHMASIIHGADVQKDIDKVQESRGLELALSGLAYLSRDDHEAIAWGFSICDSIYAGLLLRRIRQEHRQELLQMSREETFQFLLSELRSQLPDSIQVGNTR